MKLNSSQGKKKRLLTKEVLYIRNFHHLSSPNCPFSPIPTSFTTVSEFTSHLRSTLQRLGWVGMRTPRAPLFPWSDSTTARTSSNDKHDTRNYWCGMRPFDIDGSYFPGQVVRHSLCGNPLPSRILFPTQDTDATIQSRRTKTFTYIKPFKVEGALYTHLSRALCHSSPNGRGNSSGRLKIAHISSSCERCFTSREKTELTRCSVDTRSERLTVEFGIDPRQKAPIGGFAASFAFHLVLGSVKGEDGG